MTRSDSAGIGSWGASVRVWPSCRYALAGKGAPTPTGVFTVDAKSVGSLRVAPMQAAGAVDTFAVTLEPAAGVPAPTGAMYLASRL